MERPKRSSHAMLNPGPGRGPRSPGSGYSRRTNSRLVFPALFMLCGLVSAAAACPRECDCTTSRNGTVVYCRYQNLPTVPPGFPLDTIEIDFGHNSITTLTTTSFPPLPKLRKLVLDSCQVDRIEADAFSHLVALEVLQLSNNAITGVHQLAFRNLGALRELSLDTNQIRTLPAAVFQTLRLDGLMLNGNDLEVLDERTFWGAWVENLNLDENNIANLTAGTLLPLRGALKSFHLSHNRRPLAMEDTVFAGFDFELLSVSYCGLRDPAFLGQVNARSLDVSGQLFGKVNLTAFTNLRPTEEIYLRNLSIDRLDDLILGNLESIRVLDLSQNRLMTLDGDVFRRTPNLRVLILDHNHFVTLPEDFGSHLGRLEALQVSTNRLAMLRPDAFRGMGSLQALDVRYNKLQIIDGAMQPVLSSLNSLKMGGNPLHCNCEMRWFREWLDTFPHDTGADDCHSPRRGYIYLWEPEELTCRPPSVAHITPSMNAHEWDNIFLTCRAEGDPAPEVQWTSPFGDVVSVTPPFNRTQYSTYAIWHLAMVRPHQGGWYTCQATNIQGTSSKSMYIYVVHNGSSTIDVDSLTMPTTSPRTTTTTTTTTTTSATTTTSTATTTTATTATSPSSISMTTPTTPTSTSVPPKVTSPKVGPAASTSQTTSAPRGYDVLTTESGDVKDEGSNEGGEGGGGVPAVVVVVVVAVVGALFLVILGAVLLARYFRRKKYMRQYEVSARSEPLANNNYHGK